MGQKISDMVDINKITSLFKNSNPFSNWAQQSQLMSENVNRKSASLLQYPIENLFFILIVRDDKTREAMLFPQWTICCIPTP